MPVEVALATMVDDRLLKGFDIFISFPHTAPMLIPYQLRMGSSLGWESEDLCPATRVWCSPLSYTKDARTGYLDIPSEAYVKHLSE